MNAKLFQLLYSLLPQKTKENIQTFIVIGIGAILILPALVLLVLFDPIKTTGKEDIYQKQLNEIQCSMHQDRLKEVRVIETYLKEYSSTASFDDSAISKRMKEVYFSIRSDVCAFKDDTTIIDRLNQDYGYPIDKNEFILNSLKETRQGFESLKTPLETMSVYQNYGVNGIQGIEFKSNVRSEVRSSLKGTVKEIRNNSSTISLNDNDETYQKVLGKEVVIESTVMGGMKEDGNAEIITYRITYSHLQEINVQVGETVETEQILGKLKDNLLFYQIEKNGVQQNPEWYFALYTRMSGEVKAKLKEIEIQLPLSTPYVVSAYFGIYDPFGTGSTMHYGTDLAGKAEDPILSATDGEVVRAFYDSIGGNQIEIKSGEFTFIYAHMSQKAFFKKGDQVKRGDVIGTMGKTGKVTGVHLHFQINDANGIPLDASEIIEF